VGRKVVGREVRGHGLLTFKFKVVRFRIVKQNLSVEVFNRVTKIFDLKFIK
jgi:hypothetical protein